MIGKAGKAVCSKLAAKAPLLGKTEHALCAAIAFGVVTGIHVVEVVASGALIFVIAGSFIAEES